MDEKSPLESSVKPMRRPSLAGRAVLGVLLTVGFYGLALAIIFGLLFIVYSEFVILKRIEIRITVLCLAGAGTILWSILPRFDKFKAPGPRLLPEKQPRLYALVSRVANKMGQKMPAEIYLLADYNAFVAERGGMMGMGAKRVMGIGLPMLQTLNLTELQAVLAHEFGHFYGGDTRLGPWIYRTREAILRTVGNLGNSMIRVPFESYAKLFLRITQAISRRQELVADEMSARAYGSRAMISGLRAVQSLSAAHTEYWRAEVSPLLEAGFRPPLAEGFQLYIQSPGIQEALAKYTDYQDKNARTNIYDSHPSIPERIRAVESLPTGPDADETRAIGLLEQISSMELRLLAVLAGNEKARSLTPVAWLEVGEKMYRERWLSVIKSPSPTLSQLTPARLPELIQSSVQIFNEMKIQNGIQIPAEEHAKLGRWLLGVGLCMLLENAGWQIITLPGMEVQQCKGEERVYPFQVVRELSEGRLKPEDWQRECERLGIGEFHF